MLNECIQRCMTLIVATARSLLYCNAQELRAYVKKHLTGIQDKNARQLVWLSQIANRSLPRPCEIVSLLLFFGPLRTYLQSVVTFRTYLAFNKHTWTKTAPISKHRRLRRAAAMTVAGLSIPWCCLFMICAVFMCDNYHLLFPMVWFLSAYHDGTHGRTMTTHDGVQLKVKLLLTSGDIDLLPNIFIRFMSSVWYAKRHRVAFFFSKAWIRFSRSAISVQLAHS